MSPARPRGRSREAATSSPAARSSCSAPTCARASRSTSRSRAPAARTRSCSSTRPSAACASSRSRATSRSRSPATASTRSTPPTPSAGRAHDRDGRVVPRQRARGQPLVEVDFEDFPELIDALGGVTVNSKTRSARRRSTTSGRDSGSRRASNELDGEPRARVRARAQEPLRARGGRPRPRRAPAGGAAGDRRPDRVARHLLPAAVGELEGAPALKTDMKGPALMALFADVATGNSDETEVLEATCCRGQQPVRLRGRQGGRRAEAGGWVIRPGLREVELGAALRSGRPSLVRGGRASSPSRPRLRGVLGRSPTSRPTRSRSPPSSCRSPCCRSPSP